MNDSNQSGRTFQCLVADDSDFARKNMGKVVDMSGGSVIAEAKNGREAVDLYFKHHPDLVLLDITMPEMDGVDTLQKIIEGDCNAKVIMVSSVGHKEMVWKAICMGAKHFVTKPFSPSYASMVVQSVLKGSAGEKQCATTT